MCPCGRRSFSLVCIGTGGGHRPLAQKRFAHHAVKVLMNISDKSGVIAGVNAMPNQGCLRYHRNDARFFGTRYPICVVAYAQRRVETTDTGKRRFAHD